MGKYFAITTTRCWFPSRPLAGWQLRRTIYPLSSLRGLAECALPTRIIRGDGEVLEEIVSRGRHVAINRKATQSDGEFYQARSIAWSMAEED